jgi:Domain of unknown function (DUF4416)
MSLPQAPQPAKLIIGVFLKEKDLFKEIAEQLTDFFGELDIVSAWMPFDFTSYYEPEMGTPLFRRMMAFRQLIRQDGLPDIKLETNALETRYATDGQRRINLDPGYLLSERLVLATGKNFTHRIYIGKGIYADLTLVYHRNQYRSLPWTYPDYKDEGMKTFLKRVRQKYRRDLIPLD